MKKGLIFATTLAMALGVGVAVGAHQNEVAEVKAATVSTVYCKNTQSWWKTDGAAVGAYFWKPGTGGNSDYVPYAWPGTRMEAVTGQEDLWTISVPANVEKVIFTRVNGSGNIADWGAKTSDLDIPSKKNCYTITSESAVWGDPGVTGEWSVYPVVAPEYHLLGSFNSWNDPDGDYILTVDGEDANHFTFSSLELEANAELKVCDVKNDDWFDNGGGNVSVAEGGTYDVDFYVNADNNVHIVLTKQVAEPVYTIVNRGSAPVTFVLDEDEKPEGVKHQYSANIQYACRGGELKFYADSVQITSKIGVDAGDAEHVNNVYGNVTDGFRIRHTANYAGNTKIWLKTYDDGGYSIWGEGYDVDFFSVTVKSAPSVALSYNLVKDETFEPNETYIEQFKTSSAVAMKALAGTEWETSNGIMCDGLSEDVAPEAVAGNNAMQAFQSTAWKVHNDCEEVIYLKVKKTDLSLVMYIGGYEEAHVLTIGGQNVALSKGEGNQYVAHGVNLTAGDTVTSYTIEGVAQTVTAKVVGNNNLDGNKKVLANNASADIYYDPEAKTLWISGIPEGGYHLYKNGSTVVQMTATEDYGEYKQYKTESVSFAAGDTVEILDATGAEGVKGPVVWTITSFEESEEALNFEVVDGKIKCKTACTTKVYLKLKFEDDRIYFGAEEQYIKDAKEFVNNFKTAMATACSAVNKQKAVEDAWAEQAIAFDALVKEAKDEVKLGGYSSVEEIREFAERYIGIYEQHAANWDLDEFLEWELTPNPVYNNVNLTTADNNIMIIVISIAAVSALAFTMLLVFKKKKQK